MAGGGDGPWVSETGSGRWQPVSGLIPADAPSPSKLEWVEVGRTRCCLSVQRVGAGDGRQWHPEVQLARLVVILSVAVWVSHRHIGWN